MTSPTTYSGIVTNLMNEYSGGVLYGVELASVFSGKNIVNAGFIGSPNAASFQGNDSIFHKAPACIAAPKVDMVAKNAISIGMNGRGEQSVPVRIFAPEEVSMKAGHISIGDVVWLSEPKCGKLICDKLTLKKIQNEDPSFFEVVKSWVVNDATEIEMI